MKIIDIVSIKKYFSTLSIVSELIFMFIASRIISIISGISGG